MLFKYLAIRKILILITRMQKSLKHTQISMILRIHSKDAEFDALSHTLKTPNLNLCIFEFEKKITITRVVQLYAMALYYKLNTRPRKRIQEPLNSSYH